MNRYWKSMCVLALGAVAAVYAADPKGGEESQDEAAAPADPRFQSLEAKVSYGVGMNIGQSLLQQGFDANQLGVDLDILAEGFKDALAGRKPQLSQEQMAAAMEEFQKGMAARQEQRQATSRKAGEEFLAENAKKKGVKTTESGLQYQVLEEGSGAKPEATDKVKVHYKGTLVSGDEFDSSYKRGEPVSFVLNEVIKGWTEGVQLMSPGAKYRFFIPYQLGYGEEGRPPRIPPYSVLIFDVELLEIEK